MDSGRGFSNKFFGRVSPADSCVAYDCTGGNEGNGEGCVVVGGGRPAELMEAGSHSPSASQFETLVAAAAELKSPTGIVVISAFSLLLSAGEGLGALGESGDSEIVTVSEIVGFFATGEGFLGSLSSQELCRSRSSDPATDVRPGCFSPVASISGFPQSDLVTSLSIASLKR